jgi:hypothetical protein
MNGNKMEKISNNFFEITSPNIKTNKFLNKLKKSFKFIGW